MNSSNDSSKIGEERIVVKVIVLGSANVGKTSLMKRYCKGTFSGDRRATTGTDLLTKRVVLQGHEMILQLWDTAGQERFHHGTLGSAFYRGADGAVLVYDITQAKTLDQIDMWRAELIQRIDTDPDQFPLVMVGNKTDLEPQTVMDGVSGVRKEKVLEWCRDHGIGHIETSAKDGTGVTAAMEAIAMLAHDQKRAAAIAKKANMINTKGSGIRIAESYNLDTAYTKTPSRACCSP